MSFYDNKEIRDEAKKRFRLAQQSGSFVLNELNKQPDDNLTYEYLSYAFKENGDYTNNRITAVSTVMIVAALLLTITATLLLSPTSYTSLNGLSRDIDDVYVRMAFYGNFFSSACFFTAIVTGVASIALRRAALGEFDVPAFFWHTQRMYLMCWMSMMLGVLFFLYTVCVIVLATYKTVDAWIGVGFVIFFVIAVNLMVAYYERFWQWRFPVTRLSAIKNSALFGYLSSEDKEAAKIT